jgi:hypothetical protein
VKRSLLAAAALLLSLFASAPVGAQVPPPPEEAEPVFELVAPIASPACANGVLVIALAPGLVQGQLGRPLPVNLLPVFGPALVLCGSFPQPPAKLTCAADDSLADTVGSIVAAAAGIPSPVEVRAVGPVVEQIIVVEDNFPPPLDAAGLGNTVSGTLECRTAEQSPDAPSDDAPSAAEQPTTSEDFFEDFALPDLTLGDDLLARGTTDDAGSVPSLDSTRPVVGVGGVGFAYPVVFALPLLLLVIGGYLGRVLTQPVGPPHR